MSEETIVRLYGALNDGDGETAAACYTPQATFKDPAFGQLAPGEVQRMWRMLMSRGGDMTVELGDHGSDGTTGTAHWTARYTFTGTGRPVVNVIDSRLRFEGGLIADQVDTFDLKAWGAQAMGPKAKVLGAIGLLGPLVRRTAAGSLKSYEG